MTNKELMTKARDVEAMVVTSGWNDVILPWIEERIVRLGNIKKINPENIEKDYLINKTKVDVYEGFLNHINNIIKEGGRLNEQKEKLRR